MNLSEFNGLIKEERFFYFCSGLASGIFVGILIVFILVFLGAKW